MLIDSNIIIYSINKKSPKKQIAQDFLNSQKKIVFAQQNVFESLRVLTHQKFSFPLDPQKAVEDISKVTSLGKIIHPTRETQSFAFELIKKYSISGTEIFDAYLVATAISHGIGKIATDNVKHLGKYKEIEVVNPFATD